MCFRVIKPRIIHIMWEIIFTLALLHFFSFIFTLTHCFFGFIFIWLSSIFFSFFCIFSLDDCISCESKFFFRTQTFYNMPFDNRHLHDPSWPLEFHFSTLALQCERWSLVGIQKENHQAQKGRLLDNFLYQWRNVERWSFVISNIVI